MNNNLGNRIKSIREAKGFSQVDIANKMNVSDRTVSSWENGTRNPKDIIGLANALQVSVEQLLYDTNETYHNDSIKQYSTISSDDLNMNQILKITVRDGRINLSVNGKKGEFMDLYSKFSRSLKLQVIEAMLEDLGICDVDLW